MLSFLKNFKEIDFSLPTYSLNCFNQEDKASSSQWLSLFIHSNWSKHIVYSVAPCCQTMVCRGYYRLSIDYWKWKDTGRHQLSIWGFRVRPTLTWIMSYIKSLQNATLTLSAVDSRCQNSWTGPSELKFPREVLPPYHNVLWEEGLTWSLYLVINK